jgi:hypothetical protein
VGCKRKRSCYTRDSAAWPFPFPNGFFEYLYLYTTYVRIAIFFISLHSMSFVTLRFTFPCYSLFCAVAGHSRIFSSVDYSISRSDLTMLRYCHRRKEGWRATSDLKQSRGNNNPVDTVLALRLSSSYLTFVPSQWRMRPSPRPNHTYMQLKEGQLQAVAHLLHLIALLANHVYEEEVQVGGKARRERANYRLQLARKE